MSAWRGVLLALGLAWGGQAWADLPALPLEDHGDWQAVGRVNVAGFDQKALCSGVLVAPAWVLTAAHCVRRPDGTVPLDTLHFVAGWLGGPFAGHSKAAEVLVSPGYQGRPGPHDIALMRLEEPLDVTPLPVGAATPGAAAILGYQDTRPHRLGARFDCVRLPGPQLWVGCSVRRGNSGGPLLQMIDGTWHVTGIVNGAAGLAAVAAPVSAWVLAHLNRPAN